MIYRIVCFAHYLFTVLLVFWFYFNLCILPVSGQDTPPYVIHGIFLLVLSLMIIEFCIALSYHDFTTMFYDSRLSKGCALLVYLYQHSTAIGIHCCQLLSSHLLFIHSSGHLAFEHVFLFELSRHFQPFQSCLLLLLVLHCEA